MPIYVNLREEIPYFPIATGQTHLILDTYLIWTPPIEQHVRGLNSVGEAEHGVPARSNRSQKEAPAGRHSRFVFRDCCGASGNFQQAFGERPFTPRLARVTRWRALGGDSNSQQAWGRKRWVTLPFCSCDRIAIDLPAAAILGGRHTDYPPPERSCLSASYLYLIYI